MPSVRHFERLHEVPLPRSVVWEVLANTDRFNRKIGLPSVTYGELGEVEGDIFRPASATLAGMRFKWREYPFTWEKDAGYSVVRVYDQGPITRFEGGIELQDSDNLERTSLRFFSDVTPRGAAGVVVVPLIANQFLEKSIRFCEDLLVIDKAAKLPIRAFKRVAFDAPLLDRLTEELATRRVEWRYAQALRALLQSAPDENVSTIRPYEWAQRAGLQRDEALRTCLHAVKVGLLNLNWAMMCPNCRVAKAESESLGGIENRVHCDLCGISYGLSFDRYVELRFTVHPAIRDISTQTYCINGPFTAPHVVSQTRIGRGEGVSLHVPANGEAMRLRVLRSNHALEFRGDAPEASALTLTRDGWSDGSSYITQANWPFDGKLCLENVTGKAQLVVLERVNWDDMAATAAQVTALQEFRDLFSSEVLRPGRQVSVESVTLFFSDLSNSTALYESIGDASAYGHVGSHFDFLFEHITSHRGAVVKTMGDAVMAVFYRPEDAVQAAIQVQRHFRYFRETLVGAANYEQINLKIGLHTGPALVVNSNDRLDYFGRTVNIAARVVGQGTRGDVVLTPAVWKHPAVCDMLREAAVQVSRFQVQLRGLDETFDLVRVQP